MKTRPEKIRLVWDLNPWSLRYRFSALPTELTSQLRAGPQFIDMIFICLQSFILPFTGLFGTYITSSSQLAYTTVLSSAFNYHCLQLTRLVQRRSLQNNAYRYLIEVSIFLPNVKDTFIRMAKFHPWLNSIVLWIWRVWY